MCSFSGSSNHSSKSLNLGIPCFGSMTVIKRDRYSQSQSLIFLSTPKHLFKSGSFIFQHRVSGQYNLQREDLVLTCDSTTTPSADRWRSVSTACVPTAAAPRNAAMVFSGYEALYPRCEMACGRYRFASRFDWMAAAQGAMFRYHPSQSKNHRAA